MREKIINVGSIDYLVKKRFVCVLCPDNILVESDDFNQILQYWKKCEIRPPEPNNFNN